LEGVILVVVVLASFFGVSYALARYLYGVRERLIKNTVREVEGATKWRIYTRYFLPRLRYKILNRYYFHKR